MLRIHARQERDNWDKRLPSVAFAINTAHSRLLKETPLFLKHLRDPTVCMDEIQNDRTYFNLDL
jgi:hypothetical protein